MGGYVSQKEAAGLCRILRQDNHEVGLKRPAGGFRALNRNSGLLIPMLTWPCSCREQKIEMLR